MNQVGSELVRAMLGLGLVLAALATLMVLALFCSQERREYVLELASLIFRVRREGRVPRAGPPDGIDSTNE